MERYQAHLHLNILPQSHGQGAGRCLLERFIEQVRSARLTGIYASVRSDNLPSCQFFRRMEFTELSRHGVMVPYEHSYSVHETVIYGRRV